MDPRSTTVILQIIVVSMLCRTMTRNNKSGGEKRKKRNGEKKETKNLWTFLRLSDLHILDTHSQGVDTSKDVQPCAYKIIICRVLNIFRLIQYQDMDQITDYRSAVDRIRPICDGNLIHVPILWSSSGFPEHRSLTGFFFPVFALPGPHHPIFPSHTDISRFA